MFFLIPMLWILVFRLDKTAGADMPQLTTIPTALAQPLPELERLYLACEAFTDGAFPDTGCEGFFDAVSRLGKGLKDAFRFMTTWDFSQPERLDANGVKRLLSKVQYTDIADITIYQPVGFTGNLAAYAAELLAEQLPTLTALQHGLIKPAQKRFGYYLSDLENLTERRVQQDRGDFTEERLSRLVATEAKWTVTGNRTTEVPFGRVFDNNTQCSETMEVVGHINAKRWQDANPKVIEKEVKALVEIVLKLVSLIDDKTAPVSKPVALLLASEIGLVARYIEWYSVMSTRLTDFTTALKLTEKKLFRAL